MTVDLWFFGLWHHVGWQVPVFQKNILAQSFSTWKLYAVYSFQTHCHNAKTTIQMLHPCSQMNQSCVLLSGPFSYLTVTISLAFGHDPEPVKPRSELNSVFFQYPICFYPPISLFVFQVAIYHSKRNPLWNPSQISFFSSLCMHLDMFISNTITTVGEVYCANVLACDMNRKTRKSSQIFWRNLQEHDHIDFLKQEIQWLY